MVSPSLIPPKSEEMVSRNCRCVVRGSLNIDEYFHVPYIARPGETISSFKHQSRVGGKGANQAVAIVRAGGRSNFYGVAGKDGEWIKGKLEDWGVEVDKLLVSQEPNGRAIIQIDRGGENSIILFSGANHSKLHEEEFSKQKDLYQDTTHLLLQNEIHMSSTRYALQNAKNAIVFMNPSPLPSTSEISEFPWNLIDWLIVNEGETRDLYQALISDLKKDTSLEPKLPITTTTATMSTRELVSSLSSLPKLHKTNIICTLGPNGVLAFIPKFHRPKTSHETPSFMYLPAAKLVGGGAKDTTGAGDTFAGYFVQGIMEFGPNAEVGQDIGEADLMRVLKVCVQAAGMCVERPGTIDSIPTRQEVEKRMGITPNKS